MKFPEAADCLRVKLNGEDVGYLAGFPAKVEVTDALLDGENHLEIKVDTTLVWKLKDGASTHLQIPATGITEAPVIETYMRYYLDEFEMLLNLKFAEHENAVNYRNNMRGKLR